MSTEQQTAQTEEVDLNFIFSMIRNGYHAFLVYFYRGIQFLVRNWIIVLILIVLGVVLGFFSTSKAKARETTLLVQINGNAATYVYDAIEQLQFKIKEKDSVLLKELGLYNNKVSFIGKIEIKPVVNVLDIIEKMTVNDRNLEVIIEQAQYEDELLTSEVFAPEYRFHKIDLTTSYFASQKTIDSLLAYLNDNSDFKRVNAVVKANIQKQIVENDSSIAYMNGIFKNLGGLVGKETMQKQQANVSMTDINATNLHLVFQEKTSLLKKNEKLKAGLANYDNIVEVVNKPLLTMKKSILDKKILIYPILFVFFFMFLAFVKRFYRKAKLLNDKKALV